MTATSPILSMFTFSMAALPNVMPCLTARALPIGSCAFCAGYIPRKRQPYIELWEEQGEMQYRKPRMRSVHNSAAIFGSVYGMISINVLAQPSRRYRGMCFSCAAASSSRHAWVEAVRGCFNLNFIGSNISASTQQFLSHKSASVYPRGTGKAHPRDWAL